MTRQERWTMVATIAVMAVCLGACAKSRPAASTPPAPKPLTLAVLAVESDRFPDVARAATASLANAKLDGIDKVQVSKVSLEVVQLSIECVEPTVTCYGAVGRSLAANRLLFAQITPAVKATKGAKRKRDPRVNVTITLFDVDSSTPKTAEKLFANAREATAGIDMLVAEATQPPP